MTRSFGRAALVMLAIAGSACGGDGEASDPTTADDGMRVASFDFAESVLLAEMYAQVVESTGTPVVRLGAIGPREIIAPAQQSGHIDLVPEYLGTALQYAGDHEPNPDTESALTELNIRLLPQALTALEPAPAEDKNVFAVTAEMARSEGLETISDLAPLASTMRFGGPPECADRLLCLAGLEAEYGLRFAEFLPQRSLRFTAEALRRQEIDVGVMFSTAAALAGPGLVVLEDDLHMQPAENIVPIARTDALERWGPDVAAALNALSAELTTADLGMLNLQVGSDEAIEVVARDWLTAHGLIDAD